MTSSINQSNPYGPFNASQNISMKNSGFFKHSTSAAVKSSIGANLAQSPYNLRPNSFTNSPHLMQNSMSSTPK